MASLVAQLDEFDACYESEKSNLNASIVTSSNFSQRKPLLDNFFNKLESLSSQIKDSEDFKTFKAEENVQTESCAP